MNNKILKNVSALLTGGMLSQVAYLILTPVISRIYEVDNIGYANLILSMSAMLVPIFSMGYHFAIVISPTNSDADSLKKISYINSIIVLFIILFAIALLLFNNIRILRLDDGYNYVYVPLVSLITAFVGIETQLALRYESFKRIAISLLICTLVTSILKLILVDFFSQIDSFIISVIVGLLFQFFILKYKGDGSTGKCESVINYKSLVIKYIRFPKYKTPQTIVAMINLHCPVFVMSMLYDVTVVGYFVMARTIMILPINLIAQNVGDVLLTKFSNMINKNESTTTIIFQSAIAMLMLSLFGSLIIYIAGTWLFSIVLGEKWSMAGEFASWLILWFVFNFINRPFVAMISPLKLEKTLLFNSIATLICIFLVFTISFIFSLEVRETVIIYSLATALPQSLLMIHIYKISKKQDLL